MFPPSLVATPPLEQGRECALDEIFNLKAAEEQKLKTFRIAAFHAQKFYGRSARIHFLRHVKKLRLKTSLATYKKVRKPLSRRMKVRKHIKVRYHLSCGVKDNVTQKTHGIWQRHVFLTKSWFCSDSQCIDFALCPTFTFPVLGKTYVLSN